MSEERMLRGERGILAQKHAKYKNNARPATGSTGAMRVLDRCKSGMSGKLNG
ncbi:MAG: hypothetical protein L0H15_01505 [Nitrosospira sp.]|nr:hypothetical protein [Nitrosospira sp.]MDN5882527.1 hypothetical protein [Nitrosospira sp.]MDN5935712.1 hypothetical protein [Nitrosospira sp.]